MDFDKLSGRIAIMVPIVHLTACGLYMAGYSAGFGGNIGGMFSAADFFTITIQHLVTTYVLSLGMPIAIILLRHRSGRAYAADLIAKEDDPVAKAAMVATRQWVINFTTWALPAFALFFLTIFISQIWFGAIRDYHFMLTLIVLALLPTWWKTATRLNLYGLPVEMAWCAFAFSVGVIGLGMNAGDRDRRLPYNVLSDARMSCGTHVILRPIGDRFISVTPDNRRHLINDECKVQFGFVPTPIVPQLSLFEMLKAKLKPVPSPEQTAPLNSTPAEPPRPSGAASHLRS